MSHTVPQLKRIVPFWQRKLTWLLIALFIIATLTAGYFFWLHEGSDAESAQSAQKESIPSPVIEEITAEPVETIKDSPAESVANEVVAPSPEPTPSPTPRYQGPLPKLSESDAQVLQAISKLLFHPKLANWFVSKELVAKIVLAVDNIADGNTINKNRPLHSPKTAFQVRGEQDEQFIDVRNYRRYYVYVDLLESFDTVEAIEFYRHYRSLFQQAYAELGYPKRSFNYRMIQAIDMLLAAPIIGDELALARPSVLFKFADPEIEALPPAQKWLLRMGESNQRRIKKRLKELRAALVDM